MAENDITCFEKNTKENDHSKSEER